MEEKSKVYIFLDGEKIIQCEGGYTIQNIENIDDWIFIDEGEGDRYNLCQSHYFEGGLYTDDMICRWKYINGECVLRSDEEIEEERQSRPVPPEPRTIWDELKEAYESGVNWVE